MRLLISLLLLVSQTVFAIPQIQHWQTSNGANVYFVAAPDLPMLDVEVVFDAGSARDGNKSGLSMMTNGLLKEGAANLSADQLAEKLDDVGAKISASVGNDMASVKLRSLTQPSLLEPALDLFELVLTEPSFDANSFERLRQQSIISLKYQQQSPSSIVKRAFYGAVFDNHPYAQLSNGTIKTINALKLSDLKQFYKRYYLANNATISIVGALNRKAAENLANQIVNKLPNGNLPAPLPEVAALTKGKTIEINHPSTQTKILIGQPGVARGVHDYFALYVGNYILGGSGLVSHLAEEVREKRGLAYSAYSYFIPLKVAGPFIAGVGTSNTTVDQALSVMKNTIRKFRKTGPTKKELKVAKQGITGGFPLKIKSNSDIIGYLSVIGFYKLPLDYLHKFNQNVDSVTVEMIKTAFQQRLDLDKMVTVMVGKRS
ncbi:M16 family metallopeptidase [Candidatus Marithrix sp. Canyon 246]|uniref:M16 family metallopeptidase n=1 Tax=Candidatus Marithrix sp. Canyon 246 TaxID=1827136 RepID=UPI000849F13A|nr:pitrilysin family protein [Candidatus Marithrix sp. Canyon 246]